MKNKLQLVLLFVFGLGLNSDAQLSTATFGTGTNDTTNYGPIYRSSPSNGFTYSRHAYIYTMSELATAGLTSGSQIHSIGFFKSTLSQLTSNPTLYGSFSIYLKNTSNASLVSGTQWGTFVTNSTLVNTTYYTMANNFPGVGWITYPCTLPFVYTGGTLEVYVLWHLSPGNAVQPLSTGALEWLYTTYPTPVTLGAVPNNTGMDSSTTLGSGAYSGNRRPNIQITHSLGVICTGTPSPGNTITSTSSPCPGASILLSTQYVFNQLGTTYQWYDSSGAISGATNALYTPIITTNNIYYCGVTCSGNTGYSTPISITLTMFDNCYCASHATGPNKEKINNVTVTTFTGALNNNSVCVAGGGFYSDYTTSVPPLILHQGEINVLSLFIDYCFATGVAQNNNASAIWIDYNHNGMFELDQNERVYITLNLGTGLPYYTGPHSESGIFTVPNTALYGLTRMRIISRNGLTIPITSACGAYGLGETEDYLVDIQPSSTTLNITAFIQGYMNSSNTMEPVLSNQGIPSTTTACDSITVGLRSPAAPYTVVQNTIRNFRYKWFSNLYSTSSFWIILYCNQA
jgi:hypothetical protein